MTNQKGYTLIELMGVIAIIAILSTILLVSLNPGKRRKDAQNAKRASDLDALRNAIVQYNIDYGSIKLLNIPNDSKYYILGTYGTTNCNFSCRNSITTENNCVDLTDFGAEGQLGIRHNLWDNNLMSVWHLNESGAGNCGGTDICDAKGSNNGAYNGINYGETGKINSAIGFDGSNDYVNISMASFPTTALTASAWFYPDTWGESDSGRIFSATNNNFEMRLNASGQVTCSINNDAGIVSSSVNSISLSKFNFAACVYDQTAGILKVYVNDHLENTSSYSAIINPITNFKIGTWSAASARWFDGRIDEAVIWNRALNKSEVRSLYENNIEDYISPLPIDPLDARSQISANGWDSNRTGYWLRHSSSGRIELGACEPDDPESDGTYPEIKVMVL